MNNFVISNTLFYDNDLNIESKINLWNSTVSENDNVFILGNFTSDPLSFTKMTNVLNGKKEFLCGEYDSFLHSFSTVYNKNYYIHNTNQIILDANKVILSYWPLRIWPKKDEGYCNIYGYDTRLIEIENKTASASINPKFGNKPINLDLLYEILNKSF